MNFIKPKVIALLLIINWICLFEQLNAFENKILFKINNEIVTSVDLLNELNYLVMINKKFNNLEKNVVFEISKNSIIKEKIKLIELSKYFEELDIEKKFYETLLSIEGETVSGDFIQGLLNILQTLLKRGVFQINELQIISAPRSAISM